MTCNDAPQFSAGTHPLLHNCHIHPPDSLVANLVAAEVKIMMVLLTRKASARDVPDDYWQDRNRRHSTCIERRIWGKKQFVFVQMEHHGVSSKRDRCQTGSNLWCLDRRVFRLTLCVHFFQVLADEVCVNQTIIRLEFSCNQIGDEEVRWVGSCARVHGIERHIWGTKRSVFVPMEFYSFLENVNPKLEATCDARTSCVHGL